MIAQIPQGIVFWTKCNLHFTVLKNALKQVLGILAKWFLEKNLKIISHLLLYVCTSTNPPDIALPYPGLINDGLTQPGQAFVAFFYNITF